MKKLLSVLLSVMLILTFLGCDKKQNYEENDFLNKNDSFSTEEVTVASMDAFGNEASDDTIFKDTPKTFMDLFKGERKVWIFINSWEIIHNSRVNFIYVTENSQLIEAYYIESYAVYDKNVILSDFDAMTDDEIVSYAREHGRDVTTEINVPQELPRKITYRGTLDKSGNYLVHEDILLMDSVYCYDTIGDVSFLQASTVKNKEYIGFRNNFHNTCLVTRNVFGDITSLSLDSADGAVEVE